MVIYPTTAPSIAIFHVESMMWNIMLALIPVLLGVYIRLRRRHDAISVLVLSVWFVFLPNTIYLLTDVIHPVGQYYASYIAGRPLGLLDVSLLITWYAVTIALGPSTYLWSVYLVYSAYRHTVTRVSPVAKVMGMCVFSYIVAFGVAMGRFARTNTWHIVTDPVRVLRDTIDTILTTRDTLGFVLAYTLAQAALLLLMRARMLRRTHTQPHTHR